MAFEFESMDKTQSKLAIEIFGPSGAGKTVGALKIAKGIQQQLYPKENLKDIGLFIDTERRSSTKVVGREIGGDKIEAMDLYCFEPPFDVFKLAELIDFAITVKKKKIIIVDSYTAFWSGMDGILDRVAELDVELGSSGNKKMYGAWSEKEIIQKKNVLKNLMSSMNAHIIMCSRAKTEYVIEINSRGKSAPRPVGLKEDMQQDVRYEFDAVLSIDKDTHCVEVVKDRIGFLEMRETSENNGKPISINDGEMLAKIVSEGISLEEVEQRKMNLMRNFILDEKTHKSAKIALLEAKLGVLDEASLKKFNYEKLKKIVDYLQN